MVAALPYRSGRRASNASEYIFIHWFKAAYFAHVAFEGNKNAKKTERLETLVKAAPMINR